MSGKRFNFFGIILGLLAFIIAAFQGCWGHLAAINADQSGLIDLGSILGNLDGLLGGGPQTAQRKPGFRTFVHVTDGDAAYNTEAEVVALVSAGSFVKIWQKTIPAQQMLHWGFGAPNLPYNQGYLWFVMSDANEKHSEGVLRLVQANARETDRRVVAEFDTLNLHIAWVTGKAADYHKITDKNSMMALPEKVEFPFVGEDSKLILEYKELITPTTNDVVGFSIPITVYQ